MGSVLFSMTTVIGLHSPLTPTTAIFGLRGAVPPNLLSSPGSSDVRDVGVAGSNPVTQTIDFTHIFSLRASLGHRFKSVWVTGWVTVSVGFRLHISVPCSRAARPDCRSCVEDLSRRG